jgi:hypothetical protein
MYLGEKEVDADGNPTEVHSCRIHDRCRVDGTDDSLACCERCDKKLLITHKDFKEKWQDPLVIVDRKKRHFDNLRGMLAGRPTFLIGGGPSANDLELEHLNRRGIWTMGVNNVAGHARFRANSFVCSDPPQKFSSSIWLDPAIMKLVPIPKLSGRRANLRKKLPNGEFQKIKESTNECPNVWGFRRESWLEPDDRFFTSDGACWGNLNAGVEITGERKTVCTLLLGIRLLYYLGSRRIYLVGVDFRMTPEKGYSFEQGRDRGACESNNRQFSVVNDWVCRLQDSGAPDRFGLEVFNCYEKSGLRAFPYVPFEAAVEDARGIVEDRPDLSNWYEKKTV